MNAFVTERLATHQLIIANYIPFRSMISLACHIHSVFAWCTGMSCFLCA